MPPKKRKAADVPGQRTLAFGRGGKITAKGAYQPTLRGTLRARAGAAAGAAAAPGPAAAPKFVYTGAAKSPVAGGDDESGDDESGSARSRVGVGAGAAAAVSPAVAQVQVKAEPHAAASPFGAPRRVGGAPRPAGQRGTLDAYLPEHAARACELEMRGAQHDAATSSSVPTCSSAQLRPVAHSQLVVTAAHGATAGTVSVGGVEYPCTVGRSGVAAKQGEGDGITPVGCFALGRVYYRADRLSAPATLGMPVIPIDCSNGWCDDSSDPVNYNRPVTLPYPGSTESLWLESRVYDIVVVVEFNTPAAGGVILGAGSAIFLHVASEDWGPTAGCVAMRQRDLEEVLVACNGETAILIRSGQAHNREPTAARPSPSAAL
jgi:L,D-peptidoglycan transpeptidase YkuD (ErfK/YbiS/YcfS/YnhG family)